MKKKLFIALGILAVFLVFFAAKPLVIHKQTIPPTVTAPSTPSVSVTFDTGATIATVSSISAHDAFQALSEAARKQNYELKTKQYDFGVFVQQIGTLVNTKEKSWIYFVNGKSGTVAADKQSVNAGDTVEWKYMTPTIE